MSVPRTLLVPIDLDDFAVQVLDYAFELAARLDARVHVLHIVPWPLLGAEIPIAVTETAMDEVLARRQQAFHELIARRPNKPPLGSATVKTGDARTGILAAALELRADLIVMGTHGRRGVSRLVLGSVAESVARGTPCPVLLVRAGSRTARP